MFVVLVVTCLVLAVMTCEALVFEFHSPPRRRTCCVDLLRSLSTEKVSYQFVRTISHQQRGSGRTAYGKFRCRFVLRAMAPKGIRPQRSDDEEEKKLIEEAGWDFSDQELVEVPSEVEVVETPVAKAKLCCDLCQKTPQDRRFDVCIVNL